MMLVRDLVEVSRRVRGTAQKKEKTFLLAECVKRGHGQEIALAASYLSGQIPRAVLALVGQRGESTFSLTFQFKMSKLPLAILGFLFERRT